MTRYNEISMVSEKDMTFDELYQLKAGDAVWCAIRKLYYPN